LVFCVWCSVFGVRCLVFGVWCFVFGVWCLVFGVHFSFFASLSFSSASLFFSPIFPSSTGKRRRKAAGCRRWKAGSDRRWRPPPGESSLFVGSGALCGTRRGSLFPGRWFGGSIDPVLRGTAAVRMPPRGVGNARQGLRRGKRPRLKRLRRPGVFCADASRFSPEGAGYDFPAAIRSGSLRPVAIFFPASASAASLPVGR